MHSDSNRLEISYQRKATIAEATNQLNIINFNSESFKSTKSTATDDTIRTDGNMLGTIVTDQSGSGGIQSEFGYDWVDDFIEAALRSTYDATVNVTGTTIGMISGSGSNADNITDSANGFGNYEIGDIVWVSGFSSESNNGAFFIEEVDPDFMAVRAIKPNQTTVNETASANVSIKTTRMKNANANNYFDFQKRFTDLTNIYHNYNNCQLDQLSLEIGAGAKVPFSADFVGDAHSASAVTIGDGNYTEAPTSRALSPKNHYLGAIFGTSGGAMSASDACMTKLGINISNSARRTLGLNCTNLGKGDFNCTVNFDMLFAADEHYQNFIDHNEVSLALAIADENGNGFGFFFPKIEYTDSSVNAGGKNQDIPQTYQGQASGKTVSSEFYTMKICKLGQ